MENDNFERFETHDRIEQLSQAPFCSIWNHASKNERMFSRVFFCAARKFWGDSEQPPWSGPKMAIVSKVFVMDTPTAGAGFFWEGSGHPLADLGGGQSK